MIVQCEKCSAKFKVNPEKISAKGTSVRCSRCKHVFKAYPPQPEVSAPAIAPAPASTSNFEFVVDNDIAAESHLDVESPVPTTHAAAAKLETVDHVEQEIAEHLFDDFEDASQAVVDEIKPTAPANEVSKTPKPITHVEATPTKSKVALPTPIALKSVSQVSKVSRQTDANSAPAASPIMLRMPSKMQQALLFLCFTIAIYIGFKMRGVDLLNTVQRTIVLHYRQPLNTASPFLQQQGRLIEQKNGNRLFVVNAKAKRDDVLLGKRLLLRLTFEDGQSIEQQAPCCQLIELNLLRQTDAAAVAQLYASPPVIAQNKGVLIPFNFAIAVSQVVKSFQLQLDAR